ncbi:MAG: class I adenylate-forming enzyme family protein [Streptosporangiaceae bacterium]
MSDLEMTSTARNRPITEHLRHWAEATPGAPAYFFQGHEVSYRELAEQVGRLARTLAGAGLRPGDRVAMLSTPRPEAWISFLATVSAGGVWVGLNPRYRERELAHVLGNSRPRLVFALREDRGVDLRPVVTKVAAEVGLAAPVVFDGGASLDEVLLRNCPSTLAGASGTRYPNLKSPRPALIVYTSGSTGAPKGAVLSDVGIGASFEIQAAHQAVTTLRGIANLPINHIAGMGDLCCTPLVKGGAIVFQERFDPDEMFDAIGQRHVTALMQVPTTLKALAEHPRWGTADLSSLEAVFWGGAPLPESVANAYRARGIRLGGTYGMTEVTGSITYTDTDADAEVLAHTVGRPIEEMDLKLVDGDGAVVPPGGAGEVLVRHPGLLMEYFANPEATRASFGDDGFFHTGDIGVLRPDGNLSLVGRKKEMYKSGGENVYPREIELVLESCPSVRMAAVVATADPVYDEVGVAYCETATGGETTPGEIIDWCRGRLANYKVPKAVVIIDELPRLPIGKIDKKLLAARAATDLNTSRRHRPEPDLSAPGEWLGTRRGSK